MNHSDDLHADGLDSVVEQLRAHRPEATALELDAVKRRVRERVATRPAGRRARSASLMKSRLAILSMLVTGMLLSTAGAGLAIDGVTGSNNASVAAYDEGDNRGDVLGEGNTNTPSGVAGEDTGNAPSGTAGEEAGNAPSVQPARQVEAGAGSDTLPFTGFLAIPVLLGGVALLSAGLVLRHRAAHERL
jgi:hypothetical protein